MKDHRSLAIACAWIAFLIKMSTALQRKLNWIMQKLMMAARYVSAKLIRSTKSAMKIDIKTAITAGTLLFAFAGFYYGTTSSIDELSSRVESLEKQNTTHLKKINRLARQVKELKK